MIREFQQAAVAGAPTAIEEARFVDIHGLEQWVTLRGQRTTNPILLIIPGAGAGMAVLTPFFAAWEASFTIAQWEQPRAGATYSRHGSQVGEFSYERLIRDGLAIGESIHALFAQRKWGTPQIVPLGFSGGTIVALQMVKRRPELFAAYVGTGQIVNWAAQDALSYSIVLRKLRNESNFDGLAELLRIGPPPYADTATDSIKSKYSVAYSPAEQQAFATLDPSIIASVRAPPDDASYLPSGLTLEKDVRAVAVAAYDLLRAALVTFDAERLGLDFQIPMLFLQGEEDLCTVTSEVRAYVEKISAPHKAFVPIEGGGHSPWMMRDRYLQALHAHLYPLLERR